MSYTTYFQWGPGVTPKSVFHLILWTAIITISSALIQSIFNQFSLGTGPQELLSLSWWGIRNWYIWQLISFLFVQMMPSEGISLFFLITLFFNMYIVWIMGSALVELVGAPPFLRLYFLSGIVAGIITLWLMQFMGHYRLLAGPTPSILALMMVWTMIYPETEMLLFFLIPIKAKWVMAAIIGAILIMTLSQGDYIYFAFYTVGILFGYIYAVCAWKLEGPFKWMRPFDRLLTIFSTRISRWIPRWGKKGEKTQESSKIVDIKTGKAILNDDQFMDAMLTKISQYGERSLSRSERHRLHQISESKSQKPPER